MAHRTARLNVFGRQLLISRMELDGWSVAKAAEAQGVRRQTAHKWVTRYRAEGWPGLEDRTSRPHRSPRITPPETVEAILRTRVERRWGPHRIGPLLGLAPSTVYAVLARSGYSRLRDADRLSGVPVRYVREHPGRSSTRTTRSSDASRLAAAIGSTAGRRVAARQASATTTSRSSSTTTPGSPTSRSCPTRAPRAPPGPCSTPRSGSPSAESGSSGS
jgi:transposase